MRRVMAVVVVAACGTEPPPVQPEPGSATIRTGANQRLLVVEGDEVHHYIASSGGLTNVDVYESASVTLLADQDLRTVLDVHPGDDISLGVLRFTQELFTLTVPAIAGSGPLLYELRGECGNTQEIVDAATSSTVKFQVGVTSDCFGQPNDFIVLADSTSVLPLADIDISANGRFTSTAEFVAAEQTDLQVSLTDLVDVASASIRIGTENIDAGAITNAVELDTTYTNVAPASEVIGLHVNRTGTDNFQQFIQSRTAGDIATYSINGTELMPWIDAPVIDLENHTASIPNAEPASLVELDLDYSRGDLAFRWRIYGPSGELALPTGDDALPLPTDTITDRRVTILDEDATTYAQARTAPEDYALVAIVPFERRQLRPGLTRRRLQTFGFDAIDGSPIPF